MAHNYFKEAAVWDKMPAYSAIAGAERMTLLPAAVAGSDRPLQILASIRFQIRKGSFFKQRGTALWRRSNSYVTSIAMRGAQRSR
jgi:hypothetical protein